MIKALFAIPFLGRQGSSYLQGLIDSHPNAKCEGELFAPNASRISDMLKGRAVAYCNSGCKTATEYLERVVNELPGQAVGFKIPFESIEQHPDVLSGFKQFGYRMIRLSRENLLDQYISMKLATINKKWTSEAGKYKVMHFKGDPQEAESYFRVWTEQNEKVARLVDGFPSVHVTYERLVSEEDVPRVLDFLSLRHIPLESRFDRQRKGTQVEVLENYVEMKAHFAGSRWAQFFDA